MTANVIALVFNGLTLTLALGLLILILWQDPRNEANRYFALFLLMMVMWSSGALLGRAAAYVNAGDEVIRLGLRLLDIGFTGASVTVYIYSAIIIGFRGTLFRGLAVAGLVVVFSYQFLLVVVMNAPRSFEVSDSGILVYSFDPASAFLYLAFQAGTAVLVWRNRRKIRSQALTYGLLLFSVGQMTGLLSPRLRALGGAEDIGAVAALMMSYAVVRQQIMTPLLGRAKQLEAVRDVSLAVTSRLHLQDTLSAIAAQAVGLLGADGAAIFLKQGELLTLAAVHNLPERFVGFTLQLGQGVSGTVAVERRGRRVDRYNRDWRGDADLPLARETFGAVACVPLVFAEEVVGVLLVVHGQQGGLFNREDMHLLELLGPQAAVAITNSRLFGAEKDLSNDLIIAKDQLEVVLTSTQNPVLAVDRQFRCIFANPAALALLGMTAYPVGQVLTGFIGREFLPPSYLQVIRDLRRSRSHVYEISSGDRVYLCHVAELGKPRLEGWVVVANDVTQLKQLDRLKSQMIQMTSHDLKNPLQAAMSYLELLMEEGEAAFSDQMRGDVNMVWMQLERMFRLINGILDLERVEAGTPAFEMCALEDVLGRVVVDVADQARKKGLTLELDIKDALPPVAGDAHQLAQAFANLVENAVKFTPAEGQVWVRACVNKRHVLVEVQDTGIGIAPGDQERVFDRFFRGNQLEVGGYNIGSGLGLSLVKAIVDRHDGRIELESTVGLGTIFRVYLSIVDETK